ncbi:putative lipase C16A3.12c [Glarea lozoyensis 74030]|uniref:Putative lipase C16A3.12c n=1 Tax=Glarea lozoyensis (strain ATCC 74030 / MF5533) TaxID=1104152 RepID=H0EQW8_GLAL7|nr:putative lipase C16A3.12c [Glarea lozoyensis 74030]
MYDDDVQPVVSLGSVSKYTKVAKFPTRNIKTPIVLVYGGSDSLVDIKVMKRELPAHTIATEIPHYEHLDFLWAREVDTLVFPHVFDALDSFVDAEHSQEEYNNYHSARHASMNAGAQMKSLTYMSEDESNQANTYAEVASATPSNGIISMRSPQHSSSSASAHS